MRAIFNFLYLFLFNLILVTGYCQEQQYYVKITGDTVYGEIKTSIYRDNSRSIEFKDLQGNKVSLKPHTISTVCASGNFKYKSVFYQNQMLFMEPIVIGKASLYSYTRYEQNRNALISSKIFIKENGDSFEAGSIGFKSQIRNFFSDCLQLSDQINKGEYKYKDMKRLVIDYNNECGKEVSAKDVDLKNNQQVIGKINTFILFIEEDSELKNKRDVLELLEVIKSKVAGGESIPSYLWTSLTSLTEENPAIKQKAIELRQSIE